MKRNDKEQRKISEDERNVTLRGASKFERKEVI